MFPTITFYVVQDTWWPVTNQIYSASIVTFYIFTCPAYKYLEFPFNLLSVAEEGNSPYTADLGPDPQRDLGCCSTEQLGALEIAGMPP